MEIAANTGGVIVNADSMQVYDILRVLTARPDPTQLSAAPHRLYGHVDPRTPYSTGAWMREVADLIGSGAFDARPAIFVGGTGLYFRALTDGLSVMPSVPDFVRARWRSALAQDGAASLHRLLVERDPETARSIRPGDGQRIVRALEVLEASGQPISFWHSSSGRPLIDRETAQFIVIEPERSNLVMRIERRFDMMVEEGAMDEAIAMDSLGVAPEMPAMKAIGLRELIEVHHGRANLGDAIERAKIATRQYAKRQSTWFRNQLGEAWKRVDPMNTKV